MAVILKSCVHLSIDPYSHSFAYFSKYLLNLYDVVCMKILLQRKSGRVPHPPMVFCLVLLQSLWTVCSVIPGYPGSVFKIPLRVVLNICFGFASSWIIQLLKVMGAIYLIPEGLSLVPGMVYSRDCQLNTQFQIVVEILWESYLPLPFHLQNCCYTLEDFPITTSNYKEE